MSDEEEPGDGEASLTDTEADELAKRRAQREGKRGEPVPAAPRGDVVTKAPCRSCRTPVEVTRYGIDAFKRACHLLAARGEAPLDPARVFLCTACAARREDPRRNREICDRMADAVRRLREGGTPEQERAAMKFLDEHGSETRAELDRMVEMFRRKRGTAARGEY